MSDFATGYILPSERPGWMQAQIEASEERLPRFFLSNQTKSTEGVRLVSWEIEEKLLGKRLPLTYQRIGTCVGHGLFQTLWRLMVHEKAVLGQREQVTMPYLPYGYGISRQIGAEKYGIRWGRDPSGSMGYLAAEGVRDYGVIRADEPGLPQPILRQHDRGETLEWPGEVDGQWATSPYVPDRWEALGKQHPVKTIARIKSYEQLRDAIANGHYCTYACMWRWSDREERANGKSWSRLTRSSNRGHQVCVIGVDDDRQQPGVAVANSWSHQWFPNQQDGPPGLCWMRADEIDQTLRERDTECFALSGFEGYPEQVIEPDWWMF